MVAYRHARVSRKKCLTPCGCLWQGAMHREEEKMELISGTTAAQQAGVHQATWGRWVAAGKAPAPVFARENMKLYSQVEVTQFLSEGVPNEKD